MRLGGLLTQHLGAIQSYLQWQTSTAQPAYDPALVDISSTWQLLGPFQIGTRGMLDFFQDELIISADMTEQKRLGGQTHWSSMADFALLSTTRVPHIAALYQPMQQSPGPISMWSM